MITVCLIWTKSISNGFSLVVSAATEFINLIGRAALQYLDLLPCTCFKHCSRISQQFCDIYGVDCKHYCFSGMHLRFGHTCDHLGCKNEHYELLIWIHFQCQIYRCFFSGTSCQKWPVSHLPLWVLAWTICCRCSVNPQNCRIPQSARNTPKRSK